MSNVGIVLPLEMELEIYPIPCAPECSVALAWISSSTSEEEPFQGLQYELLLYTISFLRQAMLRRKEHPVLGILTLITILASVIAVLTEFGYILSVQGQGNLTTGNITLTPQQKAAICSPNNPKLNFVNTTESNLCGIPSNTTAANTTTGAEAPSTPLPATSP